MHEVPQVFLSLDFTSNQPKFGIIKLGFILVKRKNTYTLIYKNEVIILPGCTPRLLACSLTFEVLRG